MATIYLTQEKYEELKHELEERKTTIRQKIAADLKHAKDLGDLSENAAYAEAKDAKEKNDRRIDELENILTNCVIIEKSQKNDRVYIGAKVKIQDENGQIFEYQIVGPEESNPLKNLISYKSPLGTGLMDKKEGESVVIQNPNQTTKKYKIISIE
ncbi:MAG TPA: transcription elongation factor GreA [Candidatus Paceibacterota bacterium]|nr:transcription elongation factor GreA [Candidatus Paceibacterota bacterium]